MDGSISRARKPTKRQVEVLQFIRDWHTAWGYPPSSREIANNFQIQISCAHNHIKACAAKGLLQKTRLVARGLALTEKGLKLCEGKP